MDNLCPTAALRLRAAAAARRAGAPLEATHAVGGLQAGNDPGQWVDAGPAAALQGDSHTPTTSSVH